MKTYYESLDDYNSIEDYFDKEQSGDLIRRLNDADGKIKICRYKSNSWFSTIPFKYIHEIPNHFYLNFEFYIEL